MQTGESNPWKKSSAANIVRYGPSGVYFARVRIGGKLIRRSLETTVLEVAKPRLAGLVKKEREKLDSAGRLVGGKMTFADAAHLYSLEIKANPELKPRSKQYRAACLQAIRKTWPGVDGLDLRKIAKRDCVEWAGRLRANGTRFRARGAKREHVGISATRFNNTVSTFRHILNIAVEAGARYANPADGIKRAKERKRELHLPSRKQFAEFVRMIETSGAGQSKDCADLVRFLAFSGCRLDEAEFVRWMDVDWEKKELLVRGDPDTATKNWEMRRVPIIPEFFEMLTRLKGDDLTAPVLLVHECQKSMDRAAKLVGMPRITHHDLRHLFATTCIESGVDIPTVSRWLGHKDGGALAMRTYGHLRQEHSNAQAEKVRFSADQKVAS